MAGLDPGDHLQLAKDLTLTCYEMYRRMPTGLSPEVAAINMSPTGKEDLFVNVSLESGREAGGPPEILFWYAFKIN